MAIDKMRKEWMTGQGTKKVGAEHGPVCPGEKLTSDFTD